LHLKNNSEIAANRYLKKQNSNAFYRKGTINDIYSSFEFKNNVSKSSFTKYKNRIFKKPHRASDLCDYCEIKSVSK
jgi:hypothetical protein